VFEEGEVWAWTFAALYPKAFYADKTDFDTRLTNGRFRLVAHAAKTILEGKRTLAAGATVISRGYKQAFDQTAQGHRIN